ncbi:MAG: alpha/beta fold hydrolase [Gemmatimonadaceae bacterium]
MSEQYDPAWWLPDGHTQTLFGKFFRKRFDVPMVSERIETPDGDFLDIWRLHAASSAPRLVVLHGLEGSARSEFVTAIAKAASARGWGVDVMVNRGCGDEMNRAPRFYFAGDSDEFDTALSHVTRTYPRAPLLLCGISLGGNLLLKWLGEQGAEIESNVVAAAALSVPFDLARSCQRIDTGASRIYSRNFLRTMKPKALAKIAQHPGIASAEAVRRANSIWSLDDAFTAIVHGFRDAADYYANCSSIRFLDAIRVPTLLLSAKDDPFHPPEVLDDVGRIARKNAALLCEFPEKGGHVGFVAGAFPWRPRFYAEERVIQFMEQCIASRAGSVSRAASSF